MGALKMAAIDSMRLPAEPEVALLAAVDVDPPRRAGSASGTQSAPVRPKPPASPAGCTHAAGSTGTFMAPIRRWTSRHSPEPRACPQGTPTDGRADPHPRRGDGAGVGMTPAKREAREGPDVVHVLLPNMSYACTGSILTKNGTSRCGTYDWPAISCLECRSFGREYLRAVVRWQQGHGEHPDDVRTAPEHHAVIVGDQMDLFGSVA